MQKIIKKDPYTLPSKSLIGTLECGHKQSVRSNQKNATCKRCEAWMKPLSRREMRHLATEAGCKTLVQFKKTLKFHNEMRCKDPDPQSEPCWICKGIARKLELEVK